jgi:hypothetical protein
MLPVGFPSYKTVQRRLRLWSALDLFQQTWQRLAERYQALQGINRDQVLLGGSKKPAKKGVNRPGHLSLYLLLSIELSGFGEL